MLANALSSDQLARDGTGGGPVFLAPAQVTDLHAQALSDSSVVLTWTEVSSNSTSVPRYAVRYDSLGKFLWSIEPDVLTGNCGAPIVATRAAGGRPRSCVVTGLAPNVAYQFQMVAYTGTLNSTAVFGPLSNIADAKTAERVGPMLVWRPGMDFRDSAYLRAVWFGAPGYAQDTFPLRGWFSPGSYPVLAFLGDSLVLKGYLLVTKP